MLYGYPGPYGYPAPYPAYPGVYAGFTGFWIAVAVIIFVIIVIFGGWWWFSRYF